MITAVRNSLISEKNFFKKSDESIVNSQPDLSEIRNQIQIKLLEKLDSSLFNIPDFENKRERLIKEIINLFKEEKIILSRTQMNNLIEDLINSILGLGRLEPLINDSEISEIMVNGENYIYIERDGHIYQTKIKLSSEEQLYHLIDKIISPLGLRVDESSPMVDARLPDGSRINVIIPPLSLVGPIITIRKFILKLFSLDQLVEIGTLSNEMVEFLKSVIVGRCNIIISGGTGSGKTTFLNALSTVIPSDERLVTIEDAAELKLAQPHVISLESRPPNIEGKGEITIRDLVRNALRMRPDRIIIGEVRGKEALDMLQAMNTGHDGSLTTVHANSPEDLISRLETITLMSDVNLSTKSVKRMIIAALDLIIHMERFPDGKRRVTKISEILLEREDVKVKDIFVFKQEGVDSDGEVLGNFYYTGNMPNFYNKLLSQGIKLKMH
ncbi:MAG: CpaF family protein [Actinomycetota bacterium]